MVSLMINKMLTIFLSLEGVLKHKYKYKISTYMYIHVNMYIHVQFPATFIFIAYYVGASKAPPVPLYCIQHRK